MFIPTFLSGMEGTAHHSQTIWSHVSFCRYVWSFCPLWQNLLRFIIFEIFWQPMEDNRQLHSTSKQMENLRFIRNYQQLSIFLSCILYIREILDKSEQQTFMPRYKLSNRRSGSQPLSTLSPFNNTQLFLHLNGNSQFTAKSSYININDTLWRDTAIWGS